MLKTRIIKIDPENIDIDKIGEAAQTLQKGGIVAFPTETVYGLAADYSNKKAIERTFAVKRRPKDKALTVQIHDISYLEKLKCEVPAQAWKLMKRFWPGPLTLIFKIQRSAEKLGVRIPDNRIAQILIAESGRPIVAPSANLSGEPPATAAEEVLEIFDGHIEMVIDGGKAKLGVPSTVADVSSSPITILRQGAISQKDIQSVQN